MCPFDPNGNVTHGMCMQLKGCNSEVFSHHGPVTGGSVDDGKLQMVWWTLVEWLSTPAQCAFGGLMMAYKVLSVTAQFIGFAMRSTVQPTHMTHAQG